MGTRQREHGVIASFHYGKEDHGILTCSVGIDFGGTHQGFGNLCLDSKDTGPDFRKTLFAIFDCPAPDLVGEPVVALRCFDCWGAAIEGLESAKTGRRFVLSEWRKKFWPETPDPLTAARVALRSDILSRSRVIDRLKEDLERLDETYHPIEAAK